MTKKILIEQKGKIKEVNQEELDKMSNNPDFKVEKKESTEKEEKYKVKERLLD